jgi:hypothetical protein
MHLPFSPVRTGFSTRTSTQLMNRFASGGAMTGTGVQKFAYTALIVLLFGLSSGWLGAL